MAYLRRLSVFNFLFIILINLTISKELSANTDTHYEIRYWNRSEAREEIEQVYGSQFLQWTYGSRAGRFLDQFLFSRTLPSQFCGAYQSSRWSKSSIEPFIQKFNIPMEQFENSGFSNFNEFFTRKFKPHVREFTKIPLELPAFVEGRYFAYESIKEDQAFPVKDRTLPVGALLGNDEKARPFLNGPLLLARLSPVDYHRFHFPDEGKILETYAIHGKLHSVSPLAIREEKNIYLENERRVTILETTNFGKLAYIEVGALCVGKIIQTHDTAALFLRGDEKGYFLFGGSTVIVLGQPGLWKPDLDLLQQTAEGRETLIKLGTRVATKTYN